MKKIANFDEVQESTSFKRLEPNAYVCKIMNVTDVPFDEKTGKGDYLKVFFDIAEGENKGYFADQFKKDTRADKKWPNSGSFIRSYKEKALPMFKGFTNALEKSNKNYAWDWDESKLKGKTIVLIIGEEAYLNQRGEKKIRNYVDSVRSIEAYKAGDFTIPALKELSTEKTASTTKSDDFADPFGDNTPKTASAPVNASPWGDDDDDSPFN